MKILLTFDDGYAPHAATLMEQLLAHASVPLSFAILHADSLTAPTIATLKAHFQGRVEGLEFHRVDGSMSAQVLGKKSESHLMRVEIYLRLFAPLFVEDRQVVYLDIDIVVRDDIARIMDRMAEPHPVYAVCGYDERYGNLEPEGRFSLEHGRYLGITSPIRMFCSGVMVLDLDLWRQQEITARVLRYIASMKCLPLADQDALNTVLDGDFGLLHPRWGGSTPPVGPASGYPADELAEAVEHWAIYHFVGRLKQWNYLRQRQGEPTDLYWKYRALTPWPATKPTDRTLRNILWRAYRRHAPRFVVNGVRRVIRRFKK